MEQNWFLRDFGYDTDLLGRERLGAAERGIRFSNDTRRKIHLLAQAYEVRSQLNNPACEFCVKVGSLSGDAPRRSS